MGWIANLLLIICAWRIAHRDRWALLCGAVGGYLWGLKAINTQQWDLLTIEVILSTLQIRAWHKWGKTP